jgi:hypothetical protein
MRMRIPYSKAEAISAEADGDFLAAGLFWGLISAPRRSAHYLASDDIGYSIQLIRKAKPGFEVPDYIMKSRGLQAAQKYREYLKKVFLDVLEPVE